MHVPQSLTLPQGHKNKVITKVVDIVTKPQQEIIQKMSFQKIEIKANRYKLT